MTRPGVDSVERALTLLEAFQGGAAKYELRDLARITGFTKPMILRLAASLERFGYIDRGADGRYALGPTLWRLGNQYRRSLSLEDTVRPVLIRLVEQTGETAAFYVRQGDRRICLFRCNSPKRARHHVEEGDSLPLKAGSGGLVLLAFFGERGKLFDEIRASGFRVSQGERDPEVSGIAAPVFDAEAALIGALLVSGLRSRFDEGAVAAALPPLLKAAADLSRTLGYAGDVSDLSEAAE